MPITEYVSFSPLVSTSLCVFTSLVLTRLLSASVTANTGAALLRHFPSISRLSRCMQRLGGDAGAGVPSPLSDDCAAGGMKRSRSLVRLKTADPHELPPAVLSAMTRASNHL